ncbi:MAG: hypothetical protein ACRD6N_09605 [Pyrinomonadaceae bacterium]
MKSCSLLTFGLLVTIPFLAAPLQAQQPGQASADEQCAFPIMRGNEVDKKLKILAKPEPAFSREDRRKYAREVIILTAVFCGSGEVMKIKVKSGLADDVDAKAIEAAKKIQFIPGEKDGKKVSQVLILEYHVRY